MQVCFCPNVDPERSLPVMNVCLPAPRLPAAAARTSLYKPSCRRAHLPSGCTGSPDPATHGHGQPLSATAAPTRSLPSHRRSWAELTYMRGHAECRPLRSPSRGPGKGCPRQRRTTRKAVRVSGCRRARKAARSGAPQPGSRPAPPHVPPGRAELSRAGRLARRRCTWLSNVRAPGGSGQLGEAVGSRSASGWWGCVSRVGRSAGRLRD